MVHVHMIKNLKNNTNGFGISAINKVGMSKLSNIIVKTPQGKDPNLEGFRGNDQKKVKSN